MTGSLLASPTTSPSAVRLGAQAPRVHSATPYVKTYGDEVIDFMSQIGRPLDEWQARIVMDAFGVGADNLWSAYELLVLVSRQNGKGGVTEAIELGGLFLFRDPLILHSAHQFKTSTAAFRRLQDIIESSDWLTKRVKMISRSKGDESIELTRAAGGGRLQFVARTLGSGRGLTGSKNIFDEAWALTVGQYAAQTPTLATIPNPQIIYTTTPPDDDIGPEPEDAMLASVRKRAESGDDRIAVYEWSPPENFDRTDRDVWYDCNPALGIRISEWFLAKQLAAFQAAGKPQKFDTEHLGLWPPDAGQGWALIPESDWQDAYDKGSSARDPVAFAVACNRARTWTSIAVAGMRKDRLRHVEVIDRRPGTGWVLGRLKHLVAKWQPCALVIAASGPAGSLIAEGEAMDLKIVKASTTDYMKAAGAFWDGVCGVRGPGEPEPRVIRYSGHRQFVDALSESVRFAVKDQVGDAFSFERNIESADPSPLEAASLALWGWTVHGSWDYDVLDSFAGV